MLGHSTRGRWMAPLLLTIGCGAAPGTAPDDMSASEHRRTAGRHAEAARQHEDLAAQPDHEHSLALARDFDDDRRPPSEFSEWPDLMRPGPHSKAADRHAAHAAAHRAAAATLEAYEDAQCGGVAPAQRAKCPLVGVIERVEPIDGGIRLHFASAAVADERAKASLCHAAFGRKHAHQGMPNCPLYIPNLAIERHGTQAIEITTPNAADVRVLRERASEAALRQAPP